MPIQRTTIYALTDPNGDVRYVGKTSRSPEKRLVEHFHEAKKEDHYRARWLKSLQRKGIQPGVVILEVVGNAQANKAEVRWVAHFRNLVGRRLTNGTVGGTGGRLSPEANKKRKETLRKKFETQPGPRLGTKHSPETKRKISEANKRRWARGDGLTPKHQAKASKARWARKGERKRASERMLNGQAAEISPLGSKARWG